MEQTFFFNGPGYYSQIGPYYWIGMDWTLVMGWNKLDSSNGMEQTIFLMAQAFILRLDPTIGSEWIGL